MAVMTHASALPETAHYAQLTATQQADFDRVMEGADQAGTALDYFGSMLVATVYAGIRLPSPTGPFSADIALCDCYLNGCGCDLIFPSHLTGVVVTATNDPGFNLSRLQCPDCGHDHPRPITD